ncbi:MAG: site-specific integrase [Deltaproteobacteria bacterium]|nr:site-specific integrase [Deltaproteobacteria bacterium]
MIAPSYKKTFEKHIKAAIEFFGNSGVREIRKAHIVKYKEVLEQRELSNKTVKNYLDTLKAFFNYLEKESDLISEVAQFPRVCVSAPQFRWFSNETQIQIFEAVATEHKSIFAFLFLTGCRPGEARALKVKDVDLHKAVITLTSAFSGKEIKDKRKGKKSIPVIIPIHEQLYPFLIDCIRDKAPDSFVFINPRTKRF